MSVKAAALGFGRRVIKSLLADSLEQMRADQVRLRQLERENGLLLRRIADTLEAVQTQGKNGPAGPARSKRGVMGAAVPLLLDEPEVAPQEGARPARTASDAPAGDTRAALEPEILVLNACPVCGHAEFTLVSEYNKFLLLEQPPDAEAQRYDYSMCHRCGVTFARRRPVGSRYAHLLARFEETIGRVAAGETLTGRLEFNSARLTEESAAELAERASHGVFVSEHDELAPRRYLPALLRDRMSNSCHVEILTSLLTLQAPRVLELRPRFGSIGGALKRLWNADVWGLPLFEGQQLINRQVYGHHVDHLLDYDHFDIPYEGAFDLIVANHMVTHALRPGDMLRMLKARLADGGHLYLYNEPDDAEFLDLKQSMFNVLNPFHFQTFDRDALVRALASCGFETLFATHERGNLVVLAKHRSVNAKVPPFTAADVERRLARYRTARDLAILKVPEPLRPRFAAEWDQVVDRAFANGLAELTSGGKLRVLKQSDADTQHALI